MFQSSLINVNLMVFPDATTGEIIKRGKLTFIDFSEPIVTETFLGFPVLTLSGSYELCKNVYKPELIGFNHRYDVKTLRRPTSDGKAIKETVLDLRKSQ